MEKMIANKENINSNDLKKTIIRELDSSSEVLSKLSNIVSLLWNQYFNESFKMKMDQLNQLLEIMKQNIPKNEELSDVTVSDVNLQQQFQSQLEFHQKKNNQLEIQLEDKEDQICELKELLEKQQNMICYLLSQSQNRSLFEQFIKMEQDFYSLKNQNRFL